MEFGIETITPKQAEKYLQFNTSNRPLRKSLVSMYAKDMIKGNWRTTHQGIAFNCDGTLLDGQHRLSAIIESGVAVQMLVTRGVQSDSQLVMDDHAKRSANDAVSLLRGEQITAKVVAVIRGCIELSTGDRARARLSKTELNGVYDRFKDAVAFAMKVGEPQRGVSSAPVASAIALAWFYVKDLQRLSQFVEIVYGRELPEGEGDKAATTLRDWLLSSGCRYASQRTEAFQKTQRAIVAFMKHQPIQKIYGTTTHYPWPLVEPVR